MRLPISPAKSSSWHQGGKAKASKRRTSWSSARNALRAACVPTQTSGIRNSLPRKRSMFRNRACSRTVPACRLWTSSIDQHARLRLAEKAQRHAFEQAERRARRLRRADRRQKTLVEARLVRSGHHLDDDDRDALEAVG